MIASLKYLLPGARAAVSGILVCVALLSITGCTKTDSSSQAGEASSVKDLSFFDSIVTPEAVFPDPAVRARYMALPPKVEGESKEYEFELILERDKEGDR